MSSCVLAVALALAACSPPPIAVQPPLDGEGGDDSPALTDAHAAADAARADAAIRNDASHSPGDASAAGSDASAPGSDADPPGGVVACYTSGSPDNTCTLPVHCCFTNYSSAHDGSCMTSACSWGTIDCDGPEDCPGGQRCCAHVLVDPEIGITGYRLTCQATACGAAPANQELCHPASSPAGTCSGTGRTCVSAASAATDLPRALSVCQ